MPDNEFKARRPQHDPELIRRLAEDVLGVPKQMALPVASRPAMIGRTVDPEQAATTKVLPSQVNPECVQFATRIPRTLQRQMRMYAVEYDISLQSLTVQALNSFFEKQGR